MDKITIRGEKLGSSTLIVDRAGNSALVHGANILAFRDEGTLYVNYAKHPKKLEVDQREYVQGFTGPLAGSTWSRALAKAVFLGVVKIFEPCGLGEPFSSAAGSLRAAVVGNAVVNRLYDLTPGSLLWSDAKEYTLDPGNGFDFTVATSVRVWPSCEVIFFHPDKDAFNVNASLPSVNVNGKRLRFTVVANDDGYQFNDVIAQNCVGKFWGKPAKDVRPKYKRDAMDQHLIDVIEGNALVERVPFSISNPL